MTGPRILLTGFCLGLVLAWSGAAWAELQPYSARYSIYRNGKLSGKLEVRLAQEGERWALRSELSGTHGLARIVRARDTEYVIGDVDEQGRFVPQEHARHTRVAGIDDRWVSTFDWAAERVEVVHDGKERFELPLAGRALDPLSLKLEIQRRLREPDPELEFLMVEEDEIDPQKFRELEHEWIETALGCLRTIPLEKVRRNSSRYTRAWHAPDYGNVEVRLEHGKTGGDHLEMRITELTWNGQVVTALPGCAARQTLPAADTEAERQ
ncbi:MAG: DUF3108 domain-containing protein [Xanthomonadales bacterium]